MEAEGEPYLAESDLDYYLQRVALVQVTPEDVSHSAALEFNRLCMAESVAAAATASLFGSLGAGGTGETGDMGGVGSGGGGALATLPASLAVVRNAGHSSHHSSVAHNEAVDAVAAFLDATGLVDANTCVEGEPRVHFKEAPMYLQPMRRLAALDDLCTYSRVVSRVPK